MGGITDTFEQYALDLLDTIALVKENGKAFVAMLGQGFGPIDDRTFLAERAREILPLVDFIALREPRASLPLLKRMNVDLSHVNVTGDDALGIASRGRGSVLGNCLGINLRMASYSNVTIEFLTQLRQVILPFARARGVTLRPLPSSLYIEEADSNSIAGLTEGYERICIGNVTEPETLTRQVRDCRIAIVGSYHAGVYALAQGVTIVGLYNSDYYRDKFLGLEALFGVGVFPVDLSVPDWTTNLIIKANEAWDTAPACRLPLIEAADRQIESGWKAYNKLRALVDSRFGRV
jgi:colanic acid/amylovoran biosynthesis protein